MRRLLYQVTLLLGDPAAGAAAGGVGVIATAWIRHRRRAGAGGRLPRPARRGARPVRARAGCGRGAEVPADRLGLPGLVRRHRGAARGSHRVRWPRRATWRDVDRAGTGAARRPGPGAGGGARRSRGRRRAAAEGPSAKTRSCRWRTCRRRAPPIALASNHPAEAVEALRPAAPYQFGFIAALTPTLPRGRGLRPGRRAHRGGADVPARRGASRHRSVLAVPADGATRARAGAGCRRRPQRQPPGVRDVDGMVGGRRQEHGARAAGVGRVRRSRRHSPWNA